MKHARRGLELSPNDYDLFQFYDFLSVAYYCCEEFDEALVWAKLSYSENANYSSNMRQLVAINAALGDDDSARHYANELLKIEPDFSLASYEKKCPIKDGKTRVNYLKHLGSAGLPN